MSQEALDCPVLPLKYNITNQINSMVKNKRYDENFPFMGE